MFKDISQLTGSEQVCLLLDDNPVDVPIGYTVAAAMLLQQRRYTRTSPVSGAQRGPFCLMGGCFECLVEIDGIANQQACMIEVRHGMEVRTQFGAGSIEGALNTGFAPAVEVAEQGAAQDSLYHEVQSNDNRASMVNGLEPEADRLNPEVDDRQVRAQGDRHHGL